MEAIKIQGKDILAGDGAFAGRKRDRVVMDRRAAWSNRTGDQASKVLLGIGVHWQRLVLDRISVLGRSRVGRHVVVKQ